MACAQNDHVVIHQFYFHIHLLSHENDSASIHHPASRCFCRAAQTFAGRDYLAESPVSVQAFIYPDAYRTALKIRLENRASDVVRVRIVNEDQKTVYDDYIATPTYYGRTDLATLPYGHYTIELSNHNVRHTQQFRIEPQVPYRIAIITDMPKQDSLMAKQ